MSYMQAKAAPPEPTLNHVWIMLNLAMGSKPMVVRTEPPHLKVGLQTAQQQVKAQQLHLQLVSLSFHFNLVHFIYYHS